MHSRFYNDATLVLEVRPMTPLLIKSGETGSHALDPILPDMSFVRTRRPGSANEEVYLPGSSVRGVLRSHAERLLRSVKLEAACDPLDFSSSGPRRAGLQHSCAARQPSDLAGDVAYQKSCYACRIFGNTLIAGRVRVTDFYIPQSGTQPHSQPLSSVRYGVAIDRVTGAVAQGPFELEVVTDGLFCGMITVRNFTLGQLGLIAASILDISDGLVALGYGKSRGLGRVQIGFQKFAVRTLTDPNGALLGVGALCGDETVRTNFELPAVERERCDVQVSARREAGFWVVSTEGQQARQWLELLAPRWSEEIAA